MNQKPTVSSILTVTPAGPERIPLTEALRQASARPGEARPTIAQTENPRHAMKLRAPQAGRTLADASAAIAKQVTRASKPTNWRGK